MKYVTLILVLLNLQTTSFLLGQERYTLWKEEQPVEKKKHWGVGMQFGISSIIRQTTFENPFAISQENIYSNNNTIRIRLNESAYSLFKITMDGRNPNQRLGEEFFFSDVTSGKHTITLNYGGVEKSVEINVTDSETGEYVYKSKLNIINYFLKLDLLNIYLFSPYNLFGAVGGFWFVSTNKVDGSGLGGYLKLGYEIQKFNFSLEVQAATLGFINTKVTSNDVYIYPQSSPLPPYKIALHYNFYKNFYAGLNLSSNLSNHNALAFDIHYLYKNYSKGY